MMKRASPLSLLLPLVLATACAARRNEPASPQSPAAAAQESSPETGGAAGHSSQYATPPGQPAPPPPSENTATTPAAPSAEAPKAEPQGQATSPSGRAFALSKASNDIEAAQRELDVAGSSCQTACRALGSMDRAAGHLCQLTREDNTHDRCDDAKQRLYNARDKVRGSCGTCPDNQPATDRNAPVPSMRR